MTRTPWPATVVAAAVHMHLAAGDTRVVEAAADKGYHKAETLALLEEMGVRTYIPEMERPSRRRWVGKPAEHRAAYRANRRRTLGVRGRAPCSAREATWWNEASRTCARRAGCAGCGFGDWRRSARDI